MKINIDHWLSGIFGYDVINVSLARDESPESEAIFSADSHLQRALYYTKVPVTSVTQVGALTAAGFRVIDVNVTFERLPAPVLNADSSVTVRDIESKDRSAVLDIAGSSFVYSRFHLDPLIPKALADTVKREWIANYIRGRRGERLLVAELNGGPAGFLALLVTSVPEKTGVIDLIGVDKHLQGRGIGRRLVEYHIQDSVGKYSRLIVGTQIANIPSVNLYARCGYHVTSSTYVLHAHVQEGKVI